jgi:hypothetical protein
VSSHDGLGTRQGSTLTRGSNRGLHLWERSNFLTHTLIIIIRPLANQHIRRILSLPTRRNRIGTLDTYRVLPPITRQRTHRPGPLGHVFIRSIRTRIPKHINPSQTIRKRRIRNPTLDIHLQSPVWFHAAGAAGSCAVAVEAAPFGGKGAGAFILRKNEQVVSGGCAVAGRRGEVRVAGCGWGAFCPGEDFDCGGVCVVGVIYRRRNLVIVAPAKREPTNIYSSPSPDTFGWL